MGTALLCKVWGGLQPALAGGTLSQFDELDLWRQVQPQFAAVVTDALPVSRVGCNVVDFVDALFLLLDLLFVAGALAWWDPGLVAHLVSVWD